MKDFRNIKNYLIIVLLLVFTYGCSNDFDQEPLIGDTSYFVELEFDNLDVNINKKKLSMTANIDCNGCEFTTTCKGRSQSFGYLTQILVYNYNGELIGNEFAFLDAYDSLESESNYSFDSEYISMKYISRETPYIIKYHICPNLSNEPIKYVIKYGIAMSRATLTITQAGR